MANVVEIILRAKDSTAAAFAAVHAKLTGVQGATDKTRQRMLGMAQAGQALENALSGNIGAMDGLSQAGASLGGKLGQVVGAFGMLGAAAGIGVGIGIKLMQALEEHAKRVANAVRQMGESFANAFSSNIDNVTRRLDELEKRRLRARGLNEREAKARAEISGEGYDPRGAADA